MNYLLYYNTNTGAGAVGQIDAAGNPTTLKAYDAGFSTGWTDIAATHNRFLSYNTHTGAGGTGRIDESGNFITLKSYPEGSFSMGWTHFAATYDHFLSYNTHTGAGGTGRIDESGNFTTLKSYPEGSFSTWTHIAATKEHLLYYNTNTGAGAVGKIDALGNSTTLKSYPEGSFSMGWTHIAATNEHFLAYNALTGAGGTGRIDAVGNYIHLKGYDAGAFSVDWTHIVATHDRFLSYNINTGAGGTGRVDESGNFITLKSYPNGSFSTWTHINSSKITRLFIRKNMTIQEKWMALGGSQSFLGNPVTDELGCPDGIGRFVHYKKGEIEGSIYWTPSTGAQVVFGAIRHRWASLGWEKSFLGYPVTDESICPDGIGRYNHFQGGSIYWTPTTGAHVVYGSIRDKWAALGWEKSYLGYPLTDEMDTFDGQFRFNQFQNGAITWKKSNGEINVNRNCIAQIVIDEIRADWTTERNPLNNRDEAYFVLNGGIGSNSGYRPANGGKIAPPPPEDYFQFWNETVISNIGLTEVSLNAGESAFVTIVLREQDNTQLPAIKEAVVAAAAGVAAYFGAPTADIAKDKAKSAAIQFYESLKQDGHQNLGGFSVRIVYRDGQRKVEWISGSATELIHQDGSTALFKATDSDAQYIMRVSVK